MTSVAAISLCLVQLIYTQFVSNHEHKGTKIHDCRNSEQLLLAEARCTTSNTSVQNYYIKNECKHPLAKHYQKLDCKIDIM